MSALQWCPSLLRESSYSNINDWGEGPEGLTKGVRLTEVSVLNRVQLQSNDFMDILSNGWEVRTEKNLSLETTKKVNVEPKSLQPWATVSALLGFIGMAKLTDELWVST